MSINKKIEKKFMFSVVGEFILNEDFIKKHPDYAGGRIEIWHKDEPYDVEEIRLLLPEKMFLKIRDALDFKEVDVFQIGDVHSEDIEKRLKNKNGR